MGKAKLPLGPWNGWFHVTAHVYGSWLRGDPRGWRARHHREHVDGDYKNPPEKGTYDALYRRSKDLMKRDPVKIAKELRRFVVDAVVEKLRMDGIEVLAACVDGKHLHCLGRFVDRDVRHWIGRAKKNASHKVRQWGLRSEEGGLWGKRCDAEPIGGREHQLRVFKYILDHRMRGAAVWGFDPKGFSKAHG